MSLGVNPKLDPDQYPDTTEGPAIRLKASHPGSLGELSPHLLPRVGRQARRTTRNGAVFQTVYVALRLPELLGPLADGHSAHAPLASDVRL